MREEATAPFSLPTPDKGVTVLFLPIFGITPLGIKPATTFTRGGHSTTELWRWLLSCQEQYIPLLHYYHVELMICCRLQTEKRFLSSKAEEVGEMQGQNTKMLEEIETIGETHK